jgi:hypothetical protein
MMMKRALLAVHVATFMITSCGGSSNSVAEGESPYPNYLEIVKDLGGDVIPKEDAAIRASLLCSGSAKEMLGGVPISEFPTDLALIRAYCPKMESEYQ